MRMAMTGAIFFALSALATSTWAHTDEYFEAVQAPHGGQLRMTGPFNELAKAEVIRELTDEGLSLADALREIARRMRLVQSGFQENK